MTKKERVALKNLLAAHFSVLETEVQGGFNAFNAARVREGRQALSKAEKEFIDCEETPPVEEPKKVYYTYFLFSHYIFVYGNTENFFAARSVDLNFETLSKWADFVFNKRANSFVKNRFYGASNPNKMSSDEVAKLKLQLGI